MASATFSREALRSYGRSFQLLSPMDGACGSMDSAEAAARPAASGEAARSLVVPGQFSFSAAATPFVSVSGALTVAPAMAQPPPAVSVRPPALLPPADPYSARKDAQGSGLILSTNPLSDGAGGGVAQKKQQPLEPSPETAERAGLALPPGALGRSSGTKPSPPPFSQGSPSESAKSASGRYRLEASPVSVRRTFIDFPLERSPSLEGFFDERRVRSSPVSRPTSGPTSGVQSGAQSRPLSRQTSSGGLEPVTLCPRELESFLSIAATPTSSRMPTPRAELLAAEGSRSVAYDTSVPASMALPQAGGASSGMTTPRTEPRPTESWATCPKVLPQVGGSHDCPIVLRLSDAIDDTKLSGACSTRAGSCTVPSTTTPSMAGSANVPGAPPGGGLLDRRALGTPEMPSRGSALHHWGACKPCAFVFAEGCENGKECQFCHLCEKDEKKRRRRERRKMAAAAKPR